MRKVFVDPVVLPEPRFRDGLGIRYVRTEGTDDQVEVLRPLWDVGAMQNAIRQRVGRLATFRQARFVAVRAAVVPRDDASTLEVISDYVQGHRLSQYLETAQTGVVSVGISTAIHVLRELLGALALLHESRGVTHGAVGPERVLITPKGRVVVADYVLGPAIERLEFTRPRLWREFRIPVPAGKGAPALDGKADVLQVGMTALALLLGRPIDLTEYPDRVDGLVASLCQTQRGDGRSPVPAALIDWLRRALMRDANGKFASVSDARLSLESVLSSQEAATGGASALRSLAETFGEHAAALEARAAAEAAEKARKDAVAAQEAVRAALQEQDADAAAAVPITDLVPAFTLQSDAQPDQPYGAPRSAVPVPVAASDPPVGWRVPEPPPVEETLPTSPLIQVDTPTCEAAEEEFVEEVLDLAGLAGPDDGDLAAAADLLAAEAAPPPVAQPGTLELEVSLDPAVEVAEVVDLRDLAAAAPDPELLDPIPAVLDAAPAQLEVVDAAPIQVDVVDAAPALLDAEEVAAMTPAALAAAAEAEPEALDAPSQQLQTTALVDAALATLAALESSPPSDIQASLPEWRLLADPVGANAPTIDVVEPLESLDELVAEFAAAAVTAPAPAPPAGLSVLAEEQPSTGIDQPAFPAAAGSSVLDEILNLQEAQAAAQADVEPMPEPAGPAPDIAAWSFVEELLHHDERFEARAEAADEPPVSDVDPASVEDLTALPPDWFVEVRPTPVPPAPLAVSPVEPEVLVEDGPEVGPEEISRPLPPAAPLEEPRLKAMPAASRFEPPAVMRPEPEAPDEDQSGPVFPRVAPSVRRVRAEARRRRIARLRSGGAELLESFIGACSSVAGALAGGLWHVVSGVGRGSATAGRSVLSALVLLTTAVSRGARGAVRAAGSGAGAVARGSARATSQLARAAGTAFSSVIAGAGAVIRLISSATLAVAGQGSRAAVAIVQAGGGALSAAARALGSGLGMLGRAGRAVARRTASSAAGAGRATGRATAAAASAVAAFGGAAGRTAASAGTGIARAAVVIPRRAYFLVSDLADRLPKPAFRPWYLAAALVVIAAVAGVPYARARLFTAKPVESTIRVESAGPDPRVQAAVADLKSSGSIRVTTEPAGADVLIDGVLHGSAPLTVDNLAEGAHTILVRDGTGSVRKTVQVRAGEAVEAALPLRPGWLAVFAPVKLEILENGRSIGSTEGGRILTPPGPHRIELVSQAMGFRETRQVEIKPGVVAAVTIAMPPATIQIVAPADAEILVDGERIGTAPLGPIQVAVGTREILMRHLTLGERRQTVSVTYLSPARVVFE
jgi:hypothetical protein